jgi:hypothetical protein
LYWDWLWIQTVIGIDDPGLGQHGVGWGGMGGFGTKDDDFIGDMIGHGL